MRRIALWTTVVAVGIAGFAAGTVYSQDAKDGPPGMPSAEDMEKMMAEMAAPAPEHGKLAAMAGTWDCEMTMYEPGKEPKTEKGVSEVKSILNGLYTHATNKMQMNGKPFEGVGIDGYSKEKKMYFTFWADQMGSTPMLLWGKPDADGKTITYDGDVYDCGVMGQMTPRTKITHVDADHFNFEFWAKMGGMPDYMKMMEGKYTRRK
jgi:hypothetical protein